MANQEADRGASVRVEGILIWLAMLTFLLILRIDLMPLLERAVLALEQLAKSVP